MLRRTIIVATVMALFPLQAESAPRTKEELRALKKVMKSWSKALGVKCKHCHNTKDFAEWTDNREVGLAMHEIMTKKLKPLDGADAVRCGDCHSKSLKPEEAKLKRFKRADLQGLAKAFRERSASAKAEQAKKDLAAFATFLEGLKGW